MSLLCRENNWQRFEPNYTLISDLELVHKAWITKPNRSIREKNSKSSFISHFSLEPNSNCVLCRVLGNGSQVYVMLTIACVLVVIGAFIGKQMISNLFIIMCCILVKLVVSLLCTLRAALTVLVKVAIVEGVLMALIEAADSILFEIMVLSNILLNYIKQILSGWFDAMHILWLHAARRVF